MAGPRKTRVMTGFKEISPEDIVALGESLDRACGSGRKYKKCCGDSGGALQ